MNDKHHKYRFYSLKQVSDWTGVPRRTIQYWYSAYNIPSTFFLIKGEQIQEQRFSSEDVRRIYAISLFQRLDVDLKSILNFKPILSRLEIDFEISQIHRCVFGKHMKKHQFRKLSRRLNRRESSPTTELLVNELYRIAIQRLLYLKTIQKVIKRIKRNGIEDTFEIYVHLIQCQNFSSIPNALEYMVKRSNSKKHYKFVNDMFQIHEVSDFTGINIRTLHRLYNKIHPNNRQEKRFSLHDCHYFFLLILMREIMPGKYSCSVSDTILTLELLQDVLNTKIQDVKRIKRIALCMKQEGFLWVSNQLIYNQKSTRFSPPLPLSKDVLNLLSQYVTNYAKSGNPIFLWNFIEETFNASDSENNLLLFTYNLVFRLADSSNLSRFLNTHCDWRFGHGYNCSPANFMAQELDALCQEHLEPAYQKYVTKLWELKGFKKSINSTRVNEPKVQKLVNDFIYELCYLYDLESIPNNEIDSFHQRIFNTFQRFGDDEIYLHTDKTQAICCANFAENAIDYYFRKLKSERR